MSPTLDDRGPEKKEKPPFDLARWAYFCIVAAVVLALLIYVVVSIDLWRAG
jgi:hypothetical protein